MVNLCQGSRSLGAGALCFSHVTEPTGFHSNFISIDDLTRSLDIMDAGL